MSQVKVICERRSQTARGLQAALDVASPEGHLELLVNWTGAPYVAEPLPVLNSRSRTNKLAQLVRLDHQKVPVPLFSLQAPSAEERATGRWFGRSAFHQQGRDFTRPPVRPDFWVKREQCDDEWRLHFFRTKKGNLRLLRSGIRLPKEGVRRFHPWVKSHRLGWRISYIGGAPTAVVDAARAAMEALQLDFGAVDTGVRGDGSPVVFEVNTCPGLEAGTLDRYVGAILYHLPEEAV